jgi:chromosomal replication initiation ATPase DnaA
MEEDFDILGLEDALESPESPQKSEESKHIDSNIVLVHGAFGCGKSYLLVAIIRFISTLLD